MDTLKAKRRPKAEFSYTPGQPVTVAPKPGYAGCYVLRHQVSPATRAPAGRKHVYTVALYIDAAVGSATFVLKDDGGGTVVDVPEGFNMEKVKDAIAFTDDPTIDYPPPVSVRDRP